MPWQGAGSPQAYCTSVSHVHFIFLQCSHSGQSLSESVAVQSSFLTSLRPPELGCDLKIPDLSWIGSKAGAVPPSMPHQGGKPTKPWHQISGEAAEAELCDECEQSKKKWGGRGASGSGGGEGRQGGGAGFVFYISRQTKFLDFKHYLEPPERSCRIKFECSYFNCSK